MRNEYKRPIWETALKNSRCTSCGRGFMKGQLIRRGPGPKRIHCRICGDEAERKERNATLRMLRAAG